MGKKQRKTKPQMTEAQIEDSLRMRAEKKVRSRTGLLWLLYNVGSYVLVNALLVAIWKLSNSNYPWFLWVMAIWAVGLAFHAAGYVIGFRYGAARERMIEEQIEMFRKKKGMAPTRSESAIPGPAPAESEYDLPPETSPNTKSDRRAR